MFKVGDKVINEYGQTGIVKSVVKDHRLPVRVKYKMNVVYYTKEGKAGEGYIVHATKLHRALK